MPTPPFPELEREILQTWKDRDIFKKTLAKTKDGERFVFFEGPPTANGVPHMGHVETRAFKDVILRYKTMRGFLVERKAGWDTQGLPVEIGVEKELGLSGKKDIEKFGIAEFNAKARASVWKYKERWEKMSERIGFWLDFEHPYITYSNDYIETLWWIFKQIWDQKLLVQDYKVVPYCPRCGTALSSHEVAQGYQSVTEPAVYVKFELVDEPGTFVLAWTTTPWTLPGNVALAVDKDIEYSKVRVGEEVLILASGLVKRVIGEGASVVGTMSGAELVGKKYQPLFDFLDLRHVASTTPSPPLSKKGADHGRIPESRAGLRGEGFLETKGPSAPQTLRSAAGSAQGYERAYTIVPADFVSTEDGTGVVHTAVMYGEDDFQLGKKLGLPTVHTVDEQGKFNELVKPWAGLEVRDPKGETQKKIIKYLESHGQVFKVEHYTHDYPFCWRCKHPLLYYAKTSWFILMSKLRDELIKKNEHVNWIPSHIKHGRFGEWLREVKDWAISRERYWGTPLPIWQCDQCKHQECLGSYQELLERVPARNRYIFIRHGESTNNISNTLDTEMGDGTAGLTAHGRQQAERAIPSLKKKSVDAIFASQFARAKQTAEIIGQQLGVRVVEDARINEYHIGPAYEGKTIPEFHHGFGDRAKRLHDAPPGGETWLHIRERMFNFLHELEAEHQGKTFLIVTHSDPVYVVRWALSLQSESVLHDVPFLKNAEPIELKFPSHIFQPDGGFDPHRPFIDAATWPCPTCTPTTPDPSPFGRELMAERSGRRGGVMRRTPEVADTWYDSGSMPFAQWHYPFENRLRVDSRQSYPADYITEAIDQTRGWFYTLLTVATLLGKAKVVKDPPYKNVLVLGHVRDAQGRKLAKSLGNYIDPMELIEEVGADPIRLYLYTMNQPGEPKNFDRKGLDEVIKKTFLILMNVVSFYKLYKTTKSTNLRKSDEWFDAAHHGSTNVVEGAKHPLDRWVLARVNMLVVDVTIRLEKFDMTGAGRALMIFITDLSTWYIRRSRDRFKSPDGVAGAAVLREVLLTLGKLLAPFTPFLAESVYRDVGGEKESVHLEGWPTAGEIDEQLLRDMDLVRQLVEQGHALRAQAKIKVRQPLPQFVVTATLPESLHEILREELNVKEIHDDARLPEGAEWVKTEKAALDTTITDELKAEGMLRDLIREFNALRKTAKLQPSDQIIAYVPPHTLAAQIVERYAQEFLKEVRAKAVTPGLEGATCTSEIELDGKKLEIGLEKK